MKSTYLMAGLFFLCLFIVSHFMPFLITAAFAFVAALVTGRDEA